MAFSQRENGFSQISKLIFASLIFYEDHTSPLSAQTNSFLRSQNKNTPHPYIRPALPHICVYMYTTHKQEEWGFSVSLLNKAETIIAISFHYFIIVKE